MAGYFHNLKYRPGDVTCFVIFACSAKVATSKIIRAGSCGRTTIL